MTAIVFRCDGDDEIGAGHVSRCVQIAQALRTRGTSVSIAGRLSGIAEQLVAAAGIEAVPPGDTPAGIPAGADGAVVDSYTIGTAELEQAARVQPVAVVLDDPPVAAVTAVLSYHLDAGARLEPPADAVRIMGPAYAPVRPASFAARRHRTLRKALVTLGGSTAGQELLDPIVDALLGLDAELEVFVAAAQLSPRPRVTAGVVTGGLTAQIDAADVAVSGAGSTPYELACAGVPALLVALADNQAPVGHAFDAAGIARFADARNGLSRDQIASAVSALGDAGGRAAMAARGPRLIDGYGAFRAADALAAALGGRPLPRVLTYRPVTVDDAPLLLAWRNDPATRAGSRQQQEVQPDEHRAWLEGSLGDDARTLLIAESGGEPCATARFDRAATRAEIGVTVAPSSRGEGLGAQVIREATELFLHAHADVEAVDAEIRPGNAASIAAFERAGYVRRSASGEYERFEADRETVGTAGRG